MNAMTRGLLALAVCAFVSSCGEGTRTVPPEAKVDKIDPVYGTTELNPDGTLKSMSLDLTVESHASTGSYPAGTLTVSVTVLVRFDCKVEYDLGGTFKAYTAAIDLPIPFMASNPHAVQRGPATQFSDTFRGELKIDTAAVKQAIIEQVKAALPEAKNLSVPILAARPTGKTTQVRAKAEIFCTGPAFGLGKRAEGFRDWNGALVARPKAPQKPPAPITPPRAPFVEMPPQPAVVHEPTLPYNPK